MNGFAWLIIGLLIMFVLMGGAGAALEHEAAFQNGGGQVQRVQPAYQAQPAQNHFYYEAEKPANFVQQCMGVAGPCPSGFYVWPRARQQAWVEAQGGVYR